MTQDPQEGIASARRRLRARAESSASPGASAWSRPSKQCSAAIVGEPDVAAELFSQALEIQQRLDDWEGAGMSLGGLASLAAARGDVTVGLELYRRVADCVRNVRRPGGGGADSLRDGVDASRRRPHAVARRCFFDAVQAHTDIASVRGVGIALVGLAATDAVEGRHERAATLAAAAEVFAQDEGIVVVYSEETPGRELVEQLGPRSRPRISRRQRKPAGG